MSRTSSPPQVNHLPLSLPLPREASFAGGHRVGMSGSRRPAQALLAEPY